MKKTNVLIYIFLTLIIGIIMAITLHKKNDYTEVSQNAYVSSIGIEYDLNNKNYTVYLYILNNFNIGQSEFALGEQDNLGYISKGTASSIPEAISNIKKQSNIKLQLSHIRSMILKDTFFNDYNVVMLYSYIKYSPDLYPTFNIYTTSEDLMEIYNVQNFSETSAYYTLLINNDGVNDPLNVTITSFFNDILINYYTGIYPIISISKDTFYNGDKPYLSLGISGYSFINQNNQLSSFSFKHFNGLIYLNELQRNTLIFSKYSFFVNEYYYKTKIKDSKLYISIKLHGIVTYSTIDIEYTELLNNIKKEIKDDIIKLKNTMDEYNIDIFNINYLSHNKLNYKNTKIILNISII